MPKDTSFQADDLPNLDASTLFGDIKAAILDGFRNTPKPWAEMRDEEKGDLSDSCGKVAAHLIREAMRVIAGNRFPVIPGKLVKVQVKDAMQLQVDISRHDRQRLTVLDTVGKPVLLVVAEPDMFMGEKDPPPDDKSER